eukprot:scaffold552_cov526-Prasinococcus_capsulatus_cf.AAC.5
MVVSYETVSTPFASRSDSVMTRDRGGGGGGEGIGGGAKHMGRVNGVIADADTSDRMTSSRQRSAPMYATTSTTVALSSSPDPAGATSPIHRTQTVHTWIACTDLDIRNAYLTS